MLQSHHGDVSGFNVLGLALLFQLAAMCCLVGLILLRYHSPNRFWPWRACLLLSGILFLWPMTYFGKSRPGSWLLLQPSLLSLHSCRPPSTRAGLFGWERRSSYSLQASVVPA